ncbi:hypothetical protein QLX08_001949 [Tetragonisca angustula]|uniref:Uncharacterized protein n=1 Tax=Tetragonisca angustula TaxID=166442 RepID=A0AAW1ADV8_9HYME
MEKFGCNCTWRVNSPTIVLL